MPSVWARVNVMRGKSVTVVVGDDFADDSPRKRQQRAQRMVSLGLRTDKEVTYS